MYGNVMQCREGGLGGDVGRIPATDGKFPSSWERRWPQHFSAHTTILSCSSHVIHFTQHLPLHLRPTVHDDSVTPSGDASTGRNHQGGVATPQGIELLQGGLTPTGATWIFYIVPPPSHFVAPGPAYIVAGPQVTISISRRGQSTNSTSRALHAYK